MITLSGNSIMLVLDDGAMEVFHPEDLQTSLYRSCLECGFDEPWMAEDIALSVEYLLLKTQDRREFTKNEIFSLAAKILEETGHVNIASRFRRNDKIRDEKTSAEYSSVSEFIAKHFSPEIAGSGELCANVSSAMRLMGIEKADPDLIMALVRHYRKTEIQTENFLSNAKSDFEGGFIRKDDIISALEPEPAAYIANGVLSVNQISKLFPSVKIAVNFAKFAKMKYLSPPLTELILSQHLVSLANVIEAIKRKASDLYSSLSPTLPRADLPLVLKVIDTDEFEKTYFAVESGLEERRHVGEILSVLRAFLSGEIIIKY
jgi:hypothetical protein